MEEMYGDNEQYLEDVILHKISDDEINRLVIIAEGGEVRNGNDNYLQLILKNGNRYEDIVASTAANKQKYPHTRASFEEYILNIDISDFNNVDLEEETYKSTYKMQKTNQLKQSADTLFIEFEEDKNMFAKSFIVGHTLKKLPNLNLNQVELEDDFINQSFLKLLDNPETYEVNRILSMADDEVDVYLRQLSNKKKTFFLQQKLINLHKLTINERYSLFIVNCLSYWMI